MYLVYEQYDVGRDFATQVRASLAALHQGLPEAKIFVSSIPNIYQLWSVLHLSLIHI